jgi:hypothetical protein
VQACKAGRGFERREPRTQLFCSLMRERARGLRRHTSIAALSYDTYCVLGYQEIMDDGTFSFRWKIHFLFFCCLIAYKDSLAL